MCVRFTSKVKEQSEELPIILKRPVQEKIVKQILRIDSQFYNEILFYNMYAQPDENFARCLYT